MADSAERAATARAEEVFARARALTGMSVAAVAHAIGRAPPAGGVSTKGRVGELVEQALGATGGSGARKVDFPEIGIELKTIPVDERLRPHESTFVCAVDLGEEVDWDASWARKKLSCVLFVPVVGERTTPLPARVFGAPSLWRPTPDQEAQLRADYDDIMGLVGIGRMEDVSAHLGRYMQLRPKARDGSARTIVAGREGERIATVPRGFYLRPSFTGAILAAPAALP
ncbi:MAG: DNA mismatch repair protein MutH [Polyangiaceae bacterium]|nr:DNA mismatch repair protein MutH [Polyangiaceae bacterium]